MNQSRVMVPSSVGGSGQLDACGWSQRALGVLGSSEGGGPGL